MLRFDIKHISYIKKLKVVIAQYVAEKKDSCEESTAVFIVSIMNSFESHYNINNTFTLILF